MYDFFKKKSKHSFGKKGNKTSKHKSAGSSSSSLTTTNSHHGSTTSKPLYLSNPHVNNMLVRGNFKTIVELPKYVDLNEWLAFNSKCIHPFNKMDTN